MRDIGFFSLVTIGCIPSQQNVQYKDVPLCSSAHRPCGDCTGQTNDENSEKFDR